MMKKILTSFILLISIFSFASKAVAKDPNVRIQTSSDKILKCTIDTLGFQIENFNDYISLPSHLGGGTLKGRADLQILLDEKGKLVDVYIIHLNLKKGITPYLSYEMDRPLKEEDIVYPKKVKKYYPFLFNYIEKNFKFIKTITNPDKINMIYIPIRLY